MQVRCLTQGHKERVPCSESNPGPLSFMLDPLSHRAYIYMRKHTYYMLHNFTMMSHDKLYINYTVPTMQLIIGCDREIQIRYLYLWHRCRLTVVWFVLLIRM